MTYGEFMLRILKVLRKTTDKIIFATTTPVTEQNPYNSNKVIDEFNAYIVPKLMAEGVVINDLNALVSSDIDRYIRKDDNIHLTDEGIDLCAAAVCEKIKSVL